MRARPCTRCSCGSVRVYPTEEEENEQGTKGMSGTEGRRQGGGRAPLPLALPLDTNSQGCPKRCRANLNVRVSLPRVRSFSSAPLLPRAGNEVERGHQFPRPRLVLQRDARFREKCQPLSRQIPGKDETTTLPARGASANCRISSEKFSGRGNEFFFNGAPTDSRRD